MFETSKENILCRIKGEQGKYQSVVNVKSWKKLKLNLKCIAKKTMPRTFDVRIHQLKTACEGWLYYFCMACMYSKPKDLDSWVHNRLWLCNWHHWKKPERKRRNLIRLGIPPGQAYAWSTWKKGRRAIAQCPILLTTITLKRMQKSG